MNHLKQMLGTLKKDAFENYTIALYVIGLPLVAWVYFDWRAALAVWVVVQLVIGTLAIRRAK